MPRLKHTVYYGIDPGKSGGVAYQVRSGEELLHVGWVTMPQTPVDLVQAIKAIKQQHNTTTDYMVLELVHAMPKQGVTSMFTFGRGFGRLEMLPAFFDITSQELKPEAWMRQLAIPMGGGLSKAEQKERLRGISQKMFPRLAVWTKTLGEQRAVCDALLLSEVCYRLFRGNSSA